MRDSLNDQLMDLFDAVADLQPEEQIRHIARISSQSAQAGARLAALLAGHRAPLDHRLQAMDKVRREPTAPPPTHRPASLPAHSPRTTGPEEAKLAPPVAQPGASVPESVPLKPLPTIEREHYIWLREIARGGMGCVSEVFDPRLGRTLVIKEPLLPAHASALEIHDAYMRMEREARITAQLNHPSIVAVHQAGRWPAGAPFYTMSRLSGVPLHRAIEQKRQLQDRLELLPSVIDVAEAMAYAHARRIIHRDIKPQNILVGSFGETVLIDWGLAKQLAMNTDGADANDDDANDEALAPTKHSSCSPTLTEAGAAMGTPAYMSPEQARGEPLDKRSDVYAIGAVLYHILTGQNPYGDQRSGASVFEHVLTVPPSPIRKLAPDVPQALVSIVERAMARDVNQRYGDANELAADLRRFRQGQLVSAHRYTPWEIIGNWIGHHKALVAVIVAALIMLFAVGLLAVREHVKRNERARSEALLADKNQQLQRAADSANRQRNVAEHQAELARDAESERATEAERARQAEKHARAEAQKARVAEQRAQAEANRARVAEGRAASAARRAEMSEREAQQRAAELAVALRGEAEAKRQLEQMHRREKQRADDEARRADSALPETSTSL